MSAIFLITEIQQSTQAWHDWRRKGIGATDARAVRAGGKGAQDLLRVKTGKKEERDYQSAAMIRGKTLEPEARAAYIDEVRITVTPACVENIKTPWLRSSLDGISNDEKTIVEIKCGERIYNSVKSNGKVPQEYVPQTQHILAATGLESLDFWCYSPGSDGIRIQVFRDEEYIRELLQKEHSFWDKVQDEFDDNRSNKRTSSLLKSRPVDDLGKLAELLGIKGIPPEDLNNLTELNLSYNPSPSMLDQLRTFQFGNQLAALPPEIGNLTNLTHLYLDANQLTALPPEIENLTNLTHLNLDRNQLTALPPEIGNLTNLTYLHLYSNQLAALPPEIGNLTKLTELYLGGNQLTALPPEIGNLTKLTYLYLGNNQLTALPPEIGNLTNLTSLRLHSNQLTALLPETGNLTNLTRLRLDSNQLTALPPQIGKLTSLITLRANGNRLTGIPHTIAELVNIQKFELFSGGLDLSNNLLTVLPPGVVSGFEAYEICWEKRPNLNRDGFGSTYKLDLSGNPLR